VLIFGNETDGMPERILEKYPNRCFKIPMPGEVRSLNLATAAGIVLYEALRRLGRAEEAEAAEAASGAPAPKPRRSRSPARRKKRDA
jgi:tRNA C32,U32 (ribose-2'-O)-methylase TrmJ